MTQPYGVIDKVPTISELFHSADLPRWLSGLTPLLFDAIFIVPPDDAQESIVVGAPLDRHREALVELLPALALRTSADHGLEIESAILGRCVAEIRRVIVGSERLATIVFVRGGVDQDPWARDAYKRQSDAVATMVFALFGQAFAIWITSEIHRATVAGTGEDAKTSDAGVARALQQMNALDRLKSDLLATVSHELKTPLTSIIGYSDLLLRGIAGELSETQREYVWAIFERGEELQGLISHMLDMARVSEPDVFLQQEPRDVSPMIARALRTMSWAAGQADVDLSAELPPEGELEVYVDASRVQQVLVNLLGNAIKFSRPGGVVSVGATLAPRRRPSAAPSHFGDELNDAVLVSVRDEGKGIAPEECERIFEAFYQVDGSSTRQHGGVGLGLSIVKKLVEAHGGDVWVESSPRGSTFFFTLPLVDAQVRPEERAAS